MPHSEAQSTNLERCASGESFLTVCYKLVAVKLLDQIQHGLGALFLFIYSAGILYFLPYELSNPVYLLAAGIPAIILIFLSVIFNDWLMDLFAGDTIQQAFETIDNRTGDDEFYWDADSDAQDDIDEMDKKAHQHLVTVLSGIIIAVSLPFVTYYFIDLRVAAIALVGSIIIGYLFCIRGRRNLQQVVKSSTKLYEIDNEN